MGVKFGTEVASVPSSVPNFTPPHRCNVLPLRGEKPQNRPLSNLNNRRFALRPLLPVNENDFLHRLATKVKTQI